MPHRRTLASALQAFSRSMPASLSASCLRSLPTPAPWHGQPLTESIVVCNAESSFESNFCLLCFVVIRGGEVPGSWAGRCAETVRRIRAWSFYVSFTASYRCCRVFGFLWHNVCHTGLSVFGRWRFADCRADRRKPLGMPQRLGWALRLARPGRGMPGFVDSARCGHSSRFASWGLVPRLLGRFLPTGKAVP